MGTPAVLRWVARNGDVSAAIVAPAKYFGFSLSPDNRTLAFSRVGSNGGPDLWVRNIDTGSETQLTFDGVAFTPRWSPDGSRILFTGIAERPPPMLFIKDLGRTAAAQPLGRADGPRFAASWSRSHLVSVRVGGDLLAAGRVKATIFSPSRWGTAIHNACPSTPMPTSPKAASRRTPSGSPTPRIRAAATKCGWPAFRQGHLAVACRLAAVSHRSGAVSVSSSTSRRSATRRRIVAGLEPAYRRA